MIPTSWTIKLEAAWLWIKKYGVVLAVLHGVFEVITFVMALVSLLMK